MSGLIFGGMMKGLGDATSSIGNMMVQNQGREDQMRLRAEERRQDTADRAAISGTKSGPFQTGIAEDGLTEEMAAARMNMSVPEFRKFREAQRTGDTSGYEEKVTARVDADPASSDATSRRNSETSKQKPAGFDAFMADKRQALADIAGELTYGDKYDDVVKGRRGQQEIDASKSAMASPDKAGVIGQAMAAGEGKALNTGGVNSFTGKANDVGESVIVRNERPPAAKGGGKGGTAEDANARAQVASLRAQVLAKEKNLIEAGKGVQTEAKKATVVAAQAALSELQGRLRTAESRLGPKPTAGNNGNVKSPTGSRPALSEIFR